MIKGNGDHLNSTRLADHSTFARLFRTMTLTLFLFGIPLLAIYWERLPTLLTRAEVVFGAIPEESETVVDYRTISESGGAAIQSREESPEPVIFSDGTVSGATVGRDESFSLVPDDLTPTIEPVTLPGVSKEEIRRRGIAVGRVQRWGDSGRLWRCCCEAVPQAGPGGYSRCFEAVAENAEDAVRDVLTRVDYWQAEFGGNR